MISGGKTHNMLTHGVDIAKSKQRNYVPKRVSVLTLWRGAVHVIRASNSYALPAATRDAYCAPSIIETSL